MIKRAPEGEWEIYEPNKEITAEMQTKIIDVMMQVALERGNARLVDGLSALVTVIGAFIKTNAPNHIDHWVTQTCENIRREARTGKLDKAKLQ